MLLSLYIASVCLCLATQILLATGISLKLAREGYTSAKEEPLDIKTVLLSVLVAFIPFINIIATYRTIKNMSKLYNESKKGLVKVSKEESTTKTEEKTSTEKEKTVSKAKSYSEMNNEEKKAYLESTKEYLTKLKEREDNTKENSGPVLKKQMEPVRG